METRENWVSVARRSNEIRFLKASDVDVVRTWKDIAERDADVNGKQLSFYTSPQSRLIVIQVPVPTSYSLGWLPAPLFQLFSNFPTYAELVSCSGEKMLHIFYMVPRMQRRTVRSSRSAAEGCVLWTGSLEIPVTCRGLDSFYGVRFVSEVCVVDGFEVERIFEDRDLEAELRWLDSKLSELDSHDLTVKDATMILTHAERYSEFEMQLRMSDISDALFSCRADENGHLEAYAARLFEGKVNRYSVARVVLRALAGAVAPMEMFDVFEASVSKWLRREKLDVSEQDELLAEFSSGFDGGRLPAAVLVALSAELRLYSEEASAYDKVSMWLSSQSVEIIYNVVQNCFHLRGPERKAISAFSGFGGRSLELQSAGDGVMVSSALTWAQLKSVVVSMMPGEEAIGLSTSEKTDALQAYVLSDAVAVDPFRNQILRTKWDGSSRLLAFLKTVRVSGKSITITAFRDRLLTILFSFVARHFVEEAGVVPTFIGVLKTDQRSEAVRWCELLVPQPFRASYISYTDYLSISRTSLHYLLRSSMVLVTADDADEIDFSRSYSALGAHSSSLVPRLRATALPTDVKRYYPNFCQSFIISPDASENELLARRAWVFPIQHFDLDALQKIDMLQLYREIYEILYEADAFKSLSEYVHQPSVRKTKLYSALRKAKSSGRRLRLSKAGLRAARTLMY